MQARIWEGKGKKGTGKEWKKNTGTGKRHRNGKGVGPRSLTGHRKGQAKEWTERHARQTPTAQWSACGVDSADSGSGEKQQDILKKARHLLMKARHLLIKARHLLIKARHLFGELPVFPEKGGSFRAWPERAYHIRSRKRKHTTRTSWKKLSYCNSAQILALLFSFLECWKTAATATTLPHGTAMGRAFGWVVAAHFFMQEKGLLPPLLSLFYPKTSGKGGRNRRKRTTRRKKETDTNTQKPETGPAMRSPLKDKTPDAAWQGHGYNPTIPRLQPVNTRVTIRRNFSSSPTEPKLQSWCVFLYPWLTLKNH